jgi:DNA-binding GntR family transcriptional regulator
MVVERAASYWRMHEFLLFNGTISDLKGLRTANRERAQIVQAIVAHDSERAAQLMETHVRGKPKRTGTLR